MTRVRYRVGVRRLTRRLTRRLKINCTWSARPMSRFSRITSSKKIRPSRVVAALGAQHARLLLRLADAEHALAPGPVAQVLLRTVVFALAPTERHEVDAVAFGVALDRVDEPLRDRRHQHRRRHRGAPHLAEDVRCPRRPLQHRHVHVEVQPVDALEGQRRVLRQDLGDGSCYLHGSGSGRWAPHRPV